MTALLVRVSVSLTDSTSMVIVSNTCRPRMEKEDEIDFLLLLTSLVLSMWTDEYLTNVCIPPQKRSRRTRGRVDELNICIPQWQSTMVLLVRVSVASED